MTSRALAADGGAVVDAPHQVDEVLRPDKLGALGLQHVLVMYAGTVAVPLIVGGALKLDTATIGRGRRGLVETAVEEGAVAPEA
jgi:hypothetical protein